MSTVEPLKQAARRLSAVCDKAITSLEKAEAVAHATNPLDYAWDHHVQFIEQWGGLGATTLLLGMNPGPWGMAQTGVPFGATHVARDFLRIEASDGRDVEITTCWHPSPASPLANRNDGADWRKNVQNILIQ